MIHKYALFKAFEALRNNDEETSLRSLAKKAKIGVATSKRCLDYLYEKNIVKRKKIGNLHQYKLNSENILTRQLKVAMSLAEINKSNLINEIIIRFKEIISVVLYGSVAIGTDTVNSDIDVLLISKVNLKIKPLNAEKKLKKELKIIGYTTDEWRKKAETDKAFYDKVIIDGIPLYGEMPVVK